MSLGSDKTARDSLYTQYRMGDGRRTKIFKMLEQISSDIVYEVPCFIITSSNNITITG
ncbi:uncharacterized protein DS421_3g77770 [Arachis hypogaea]|nr:uncharacterized protein DS421_3g77770 [Arachis hypogaea]